MLLSKLLKGVEAKGNFTDSEITDITDNSKNITKGCLFVCIQGARFDGHSAASEAVEKGAAAVVVERDTGVCNQITVENSRAAYARICANFYGNPSEKLKLIGVTGTNGKTTTTFLLKDIFDRLGVKSGLIGTVKNVTGKGAYTASLTTPDSKDLQKLFCEMVESGCEYCIMEVSSQALAQGRVDGCHFSVGLFTNLTQDHLDYHETFENYKDAKRRLFEMSDTAVLNIDDAAAPAMVAGLPCKTVSFSTCSNTADFVAKNIQCTASSVQYELLWNDRIGRVQVAIPGHFTVYNSMGAAICAIESGCDFKAVLTALASGAGVPGRVEVVPTATEYTILIDYAHSPDGLENVLASVRETTAGRIITVFGCGGDRDETKRPKMGKIVGDMSDIAIVTSDNPRSENPEQIVQDILTGMTGCKARIKTLVNRTDAIRCAMQEAKKGDVVLLAGKGHETYQILNTGKIHYDEREIVAQILKESAK